MECQPFRKIKSGIISFFTSYKMITKENQSKSSKLVQCNYLSQMAFSVQWQQLRKNERRASHFNPINFFHLQNLLLGFLALVFLPNRQAPHSFDKENECNAGSEERVGLASSDEKNE